MRVKFRQRSVVKRVVRRGVKRRVARSELCLVVEFRVIKWHSISVGVHYNCECIRQFPG